MTQKVVMPWTIALILAALAPIMMAYLGFSVKWGAHPYWDIKTALIGAGVGIGASLCLAWMSKGLRLLLGLLMLGGSIWAATYGKTQFAASYAEDAFAGKLWFFGWIGIAAAMTLIVSELRHSLRRIL